MKKVVFFILLYSILSCQQDRPISFQLNVYNKFLVEQKGFTKHISLGDEVFLKKPVQLMMNDSFLFILDRQPEEYFVHMYYKDSYEYYRSVCKYGEGPGEFNYIINIQVDENNLYVYTIVEGVSSYSIENIKQGNLEKTNHIGFSHEYGMLSRGIKLGNEFYLLSFNDPNEERIFVFDSNEGNELKKIGQLPIKNKNSLNFSIQKQGWASLIDGKDNYIVLATKQGEVIDIIDKNFPEKQITIKGPNGDPLFSIVENKYSIPIGIHGFYDVKIGNNLIYALFHGGEVMTENPPVFYGCKSLYIYSLQGEPLKKINLDRYISNIFIDDVTGIIYGMDLNEDDPLYTIHID